MKTGERSVARSTAGGLSLAAVLLLAVGWFDLQGCSGDDGGDDDTPSLTISGYVSNQSTAMRVRPPRSMLAALWQALSLIPEAHAGRSGVIITICEDTDPSVEDLDEDDVPECQTVTDAFGFFAVEAAAGGNLTATFDTGGAVFSRGVFAPRGAAISLAGVTLQTDGSAPSESAYAFVTGTIQGANCGVVPRTLSLETPDAVTVFLADDVEIVTSEGITCPALNESIDSSFLVEGVEQSDGSIVASRITSSGFSVTGLTQFRARVDSTNCSISMSVTRSDGESVLVNLTASRYERGIDECADLTAGQDVVIRGVPRKVGEFSASIVSLE